MPGFAFGFGHGYTPSKGGGDIAALTPEQMGALAAAKSGTFLHIDPAYCYQVRSTTPTTPAGIGDKVGCIVGRDGTYFAVADSDARRGTLRQDECGHYYIDTAASGAADSAYHVWGAAGSGARLQLGNAYTHIGGWQGPGGRAFSTAANNNAAVDIASAPNFGNRSFVRSPAGASQYLFDSTDVAPTEVPHVFRLVKSATAQGFYGDSLVAGKDAVTAYDTSALAQGLALFCYRYNLITLEYTGRFYGGFWCPGTLTNSQTVACARGMMALTVPGTPTAYTVSTDPVVLDFTGDEFEWGGSSRVIADLTDNGDGTYELDYIDWWDQTRTIIVDYEIAAGMTPTGVAVAMDHSGTVDETVQPIAAQSPTTQVHYRSSEQYRVPDYNPIFVSTATANTFFTKRNRVAWVIEPGSIPKSWRHLTPQTPNGAASTPALPPSSVTIGRDAAGSNLLTNATVHRVALYSGAKSDTDIVPLLSAGVADPILFLGDSFVSQGNYPWRMEALTESFGYVNLNANGVGGSTLLEQAARLADLPHFHGATLVIVDGSREQDAAASLAAIADMAALLDHSRYIYLEPNPINPIGDSRRTDWEADSAAMKTPLGWRYVLTLEAFFAANDGSSNDLTDVLAGKYPRSISADGIHPSPTSSSVGHGIITLAAYGIAVDQGWLPGTTAVPDAVQSLAASGNDLTWSAPADDGNHPVLGYLVEQETSPGVWTPLAAQGSPTGYTKQYIRAYTVSGAGTYRVSAINAKGAGAPDTVVVT